MKSRHGDLALLAIRLAPGIVFFVHGAQKTLGWFGGHGLHATVQVMTKMGLPHIVPYLVSFGELAAGLGLIVGLLARIAAAGMFIEMLGAVLIIHFKFGFFAEHHGFEYPLTLCLVSFGVLLLGPGAYSLDASLRRKG